ncbi:hypothetical protein PR048_033409 [Dryococelus australis]|uniref:Uncharacterized protein n=1 Tax=Dryococelus australis TaxID=614101 RepID=A0ABQ9G314_9NEOP|nr:hypothetical protein PR048_033409 [Dryococelus australis]
MTKNQYKADFTNMNCKKKKEMSLIRCRGFSKVHDSWVKIQYLKDLGGICGLECQARKYSEASSCGDRNQWDWSLRTWRIRTLKCETDGGIAQSLGNADEVLRGEGGGGGGAGGGDEESLPIMRSSDGQNRIILLIGFYSDSLRHLLSRRNTSNRMIHSNTTDKNREFDYSATFEYPNCFHSILPITNAVDQLSAARKPSLELPSLTDINTLGSTSCYIRKNIWLEDGKLGTPLVRSRPIRERLGRVVNSDISRGRNDNRGRRYCKRQKSWQLAFQDACSWADGTARQILYGLQTAAGCARSQLPPCRPFPGATYIHSPARSCGDSSARLGELEEGKPGQREDGTTLSTANGQLTSAYFYIRLQSLACRSLNPQILLVYTNRIAQGKGDVIIGDTYWSCTAATMTSPILRNMPDLNEYR